MLPISTRDTIRFTPAGLEGQDGAPVYLLIVPTLRTRAAFRRELAAAGAVWHDDAAMLQTLREAIAAMFADDQAPALLAVVDRFDAARKAIEEKAGTPATSSDDAASSAEMDAFRALGQEIAELEAAARAQHPPYARRAAERSEYLQIAPALAAQIFLKGWENVSQPFVRRGGMATDECLMAIDENHLVQIGWKAMSLFRPSEAQAKN